MKAQLLIILVFAAVIGSVCMVAFHRRPGPGVAHIAGVIEPAVVRTATLDEKSYPITEFFYGLIEANKRVDMAFQVAGRIVQLGSQRSQVLAENQIVQQGDMIAKLEPARYEVAVEQAKALSENAKASMSTARAEIDRVNAELENAKDDLKRFEELRNANASTVREVEKAELQVKVLQARLDSAQAMLSAAQAEYRSARASSSMANVNLQDTVLRAPMEATVAAIPTEIGQMVSPGQTVITLIDLNRVKLAIGVVERKLPLLQEGQKVSVEILALSSQAGLISDSPEVARSREGIVTVVPPAADQQTGLFNVEVELDNNDGLLYPGMIGKATVTVMEQRAIAIPASAAIRSGDRAWAFFVEDGYSTGLDLGPIGTAPLRVPAPVARRVWFTPIVFDKDYYMVKSLPKKLHRVVVEGHTRLSDGQTVNEIETVVIAPAATPPLNTGN